MEKAEGGLRTRQRPRTTNGFKWGNRRRRTTIVSLSASAMVGDRERFLASGMDGYLAKPFTAEELYATVRQFASSKQRIAG